METARSEFIIGLRGFWPMAQGSSHPKRAHPLWEFRIIALGNVIPAMSKSLEFISPCGLRLMV